MNKASVTQRTAAYILAKAEEADPHAEAHARINKGHEGLTSYFAAVIKKHIGEHAKDVHQYGLHGKHSAVLALQMASDQHDRAASAVKDSPGQEELAMKHKYAREIFRHWGNSLQSGLHESKGHSASAAHLLAGLAHKSGDSGAKAAHEARYEGLASEYRAGTGMFYQRPQTPEEIDHTNSLKSQLSTVDPNSALGKLMAKKQGNK